MSVIGVFTNIYTKNVLSYRQKAVLLHSGKSYTTSSLLTPPGLDRSKGRRL